MTAITSPPIISLYSDHRSDTNFSGSVGLTDGQEKINAQSTYIDYNAQEIEICYSSEAKTKDTINPLTFAHLSMGTALTATVFGTTNLLTFTLADALIIHPYTAFLLTIGGSFLLASNLVAIKESNYGKNR